jgi:cob(I)alamin adenosyltransferase
MSDETAPATVQPASGEPGSAAPASSRRGSAAGDGGYTDLLGGRRVAKHDPCVEAIGLLDAATSALGLARAAASRERTRRLIQQAQQDLYAAMAELAFPPDHTQARRILPEHVAWLERCVATVQAPFQNLRRFVLPGACHASATLDVARASVRTAERQLARLAHGNQLAGDAILAYVNRLSLLLYYLARDEDVAAGVDLDLAGGPAERPEA